MSVSPATRPWTKIRSEIAVAARLNPTADTTDLRRELKAARAAEYILNLVTSAPPLTDEQRNRLASLLAPAQGGGAA